METNTDNTKTGRMIVEMLVSAPAAQSDLLTINSEIKMDSFDLQKESVKNLLQNYNDIQITTALENLSRIQASVLSDFFKKLQAMLIERQNEIKNATTVALGRNAQESKAETDFKATLTLLSTIENIPINQLSRKLTTSPGNVTKWTHELYATFNNKQKQTLAQNLETISTEASAIPNLSLIKGCVYTINIVNPKCNKKELEQNINALIETRVNNNLTPDTKNAIELKKQEFIDLLNKINGQIKKLDSTFNRLIMRIDPQAKIDALEELKLKLVGDFKDFVDGEIKKTQNNNGAIITSVDNNQIYKKTIMSWKSQKNETLNAPRFQFFCAPPKSTTKTGEFAEKLVKDYASPPSPLRK